MTRAARSAILAIVLRIHFSFEDLALTRIAEGADFGAEMLYSLHVLNSRPRDLRFGRWVRAARRTRAGSLLSQLCSTTVMPDFLGSAVASDPRETSDNAVRLNPDLLRSELQLLSRYRDQTPFAQALADGDRQARRVFAQALGSYQAASIQTWMPQIDTLVAAERRHWSTQAAAGLGHLLQQLHPGISWAPPTLTVEKKTNLEVHLNGRGLLIQPTLFGDDAPWIAIDRRGQPVLRIPLRRPPVLSEREPESPEALTHLLGKTRASVLRFIADRGPCRTGDIAQHLDCSPTSVSDHTAVLRDSGLITTVRAGQSVQHAVTDTGEAVVCGSLR